MITEISANSIGEHPKIKDKYKAETGNRFFLNMKYLFNRMVIKELKKTVTRSSTLKWSITKIMF